MKHWTKDEDSVLREWYPVEGRSCANRLGGRSEGACKARAQLLGIVGSGKWSEEEDKVLKERYEKEGKKCFQDLEKSERECMMRVRELHLHAGKSNIWSEEEDDVLRREYGIRGSVGCWELLGNGKTLFEVKMRIKELGIKSGSIS